MQMVDGYIAEHGEDGTITFYYDDELKEIKEQKRSRQEKEKLEQERLDFKQFRLGFTTATCFLIFLWTVFSTWNTTLASLFLIILHYIPAILYIYSCDNCLKYYYMYNIKFDTGPLYIVDIIAIVMTVLILVATCQAFFLDLFPNFPSILIRVISLIILFITIFYLLVTEKYKKIDKNINETTRYILAVGGLTFFINAIFFKFSHVAELFLLFPILTYFLSEKIFRISVLKRYDLFIIVFKNVVYNLRIGILVLILSYFFIHLFKDGLYYPGLAILILLLLYFIYSD